ncbi:cyclophilin-like fold protein [Niameybacter massiliensis]|uniref:cyclophilin-like fold protein n=1 Tax=Niameybacter massiliensis TaxID=1658108 RepID=UPI0006B3F919|nr:cyclophilin-like fold protein [Niameybacter massiliensis]
MHKIINSLAVFILFGIISGCGNRIELIEKLPSSIELPVNSIGVTQQVDGRVPQLEMIIGAETYSITLYDNETVRTFINLLPMTITLNELNGNEKYSYMDSSLPTNEITTVEIKAGDLKLYGSDCLVVFYKDFDSSYKYTDLGYVENADSLFEVLGNGTVEITFAVKE